MLTRFLLHLLRWGVLIGATLVAVGAVPIVINGAEGMTGESGPITFSVVPAVGLTDGQVVDVHAGSTDGGVVIFSITAHLCATDKVTGDRSFSFAGVACTNVPVGQSDVEQTNVTGGTASADLQFKVGAGRATWLSSTGYDGSIACGPGQPCDLVIRAEITNGTVYYKQPLCFGTGCAADPSAPAPAPPAAGNAGGGAAATADASDASSGSGQAVPGGAGSVTGGKVAGGKGSGGTSRSDASAAESAAGTRQQSTVGASSDSSSGRWRVVAAALAGALGGIRIFSIVMSNRRRTGMGVVG